MSGENKVSGADVGVGFRGGIVRIQVEETIVRVRVVVTADVGDRVARVRVDAENTNEAHTVQIIPRKL